mgnify:CR=1 FL=1|jgi:hypothetical protein
MLKTLFCDHGSHTAMNIRTIFVQFCNQNGSDRRVTDKVDGCLYLREHIALTKLSLLGSLTVEYLKKLSQVA